MKNELFVFCALFLGMNAAKAQIETTTNTVQFEVEDTNTKDPTGLKLPAREKPSLTLPKDERDPKTQLSVGEEEPEPFDMMKGDGLLLNDQGKAPKAFTRDKEPLPEYAKDQYLGEVKTASLFVSVKYRDHEYVDGDLIRVYVNHDIVQSSVFLGGSFSGFTLTLEEGLNEIVFEALNQGSSGPNTAELHVYDDNGFIISAKEWNLLTGNRATIKVIRE
ncbi:MAG: hypothetical protein HKO54_01970 [Flavobacteriaceae bacterium]|nr:hypothetical protein [Flavobacteriaceae bacterium]